jgi:hypothetical protein
LPLKRAENVVGERGVEVRRYGERPSRQSERSRHALGRRERTDFSHRPSVTGDDEALTGLDVVEECGGFPFQVLQADGEPRFSSQPNSVR